jgi:hypothetical protein
MDVKGNFVEILDSLFVYRRRAVNASDGIVNLSSSRRVWHTRPMNTPVPTNRYKNHRFPPEIISHAVWLYFRFCLSYRDVEE